MNILNALVFRSQRQFPKESLIEIQHFREKLRHRKAPLSVLMIMIRKPKPTHSSLHHLGEAGGRQMYCLNTWVGWRQLFSLNIKQWPSLSEPHRLNCILDISKKMTCNSQLQRPERNSSNHSYVLNFSVSFTQGYEHVHILVPTQQLQGLRLRELSCPRWQHKEGRVDRSGCKPSAFATTPWWSRLRWLWFF